MRYTTKTEYGVICLAHMAKKPWPGASTVKEIAEHEGFSVTFTEKILQSLRRAGIVTSQQGNKGGWMLTRPSADISLKEIIEALEGSTFEAFCAPKRRKTIVCTHFSLCKLKPIWYKTQKTLDELYQTITLATIAEDVMNAPLKPAIVFPPRGVR
ncbi:MAG TPA: Rrf2 family transcriptional regulator [Candidatus Omnitrophota bacterium]|nr:Rrf2 family transcriptional regulator [Candidatus Omnitrophota bacterium]HPS36848.1 Rrf2 family transcriptional regulator [Candidatus Omnitrophota bacterium]